MGNRPEYGAEAIRVGRLIGERLETWTSRGLALGTSASSFRFFLSSPNILSFPASPQRLSSLPGQDIFTLCLNCSSYRELNNLKTLHLQWKLLKINRNLVDRALASTVFSMVYGKHTSEWGKHSRTQGFFPKVPSPWRLWCRDLAMDLTQSSALGVRMFPPLVTNFFFFKLFCGSFLSTAANQDNNFSLYRIFNNWIFLEKEFICSVPWVFFFFLSYLHWGKKRVIYGVVWGIVFNSL